MLSVGVRVRVCRYVVVPYTDFPQLLGVLLRLLNGEQAWAMRHEVLKVRACTRTTEEPARCIQSPFRRIQPVWR